jgi:hypothetical protein
MLENFDAINFDNLKNSGDLMNSQVKKIIDLNVRTFDKLSKETAVLTDLLQAKHPEEFIAAQMNCVKTAAMNAVEYSQELCSIVLDGFSQATNHATPNSYNGDNSKQSSPQKRKD